MIIDGSSKAVPFVSEKQKKMIEKIASLSIRHILKYGGTFTTDELAKFFWNGFNELTKIEEKVESVTK